MKKVIKSTLSKGVTAVLNRTLTSSANESSSYVFSQPYWRMITLSYTDMQFNIYY